ncbi:hypothetical protein C8Q75DRAFT_733413 [Abortiporus biennis]|nr:hypothetical protein C8Q75DRAFT_733413 [Abortiporus biennis]
MARAFTLFAFVLFFLAQSINAAPAQAGELKARVDHDATALLFPPNNAVRSCGGIYTGSEYFIAISSELADSVSDKYCGRWIELQNTENGKTASFIVADQNPSERSKYDLDLSQNAFNKLRSDSQDASFPVEWNFHPAGWTPSN